VKPASRTDVLVTEEGKEIRMQVGTNTELDGVFSINVPVELYVSPVKHSWRSERPPWVPGPPIDIRFGGQPEPIREDMAQ
jgi:hypothetical protein